MGGKDLILFWEGSTVVESYAATVNPGGKFHLTEFLGNLIYLLEKK